MKVIYKWEHSCLKVHLLGILQGFGLILDGVIILGTFGQYASGFTLAAARKRAYAHIQRLKSLKESKQ